MKDVTTTSATVTIGINLGDRFSHYCVLYQAGTVIDEGHLATCPSALEVRFAGVPRARIVIEVGTVSGTPNDSSPGDAVLGMREFHVALDPVRNPGADPFGGMTDGPESSQFTALPSGKSQV